jgi:hypothetical protein
MPYRGLLLVVALFALGCQSAPRLEHTQVVREQVSEDEAVVASALVFDPPVAQDDEPLALSRLERQPSVSVGYEDLTTEYFYIRMDDRQISNGYSGGGRGGGSGNYDRYERRAVTERVGVRYR